jgi:hypothetical protein
MGLLTIGSLPLRGETFFPYGLPQVDDVHCPYRLLETLALRQSKQARSQARIRPGCPQKDLLFKISPLSFKLDGLMALGLFRRPTSSK